MAVALVDCNSFYCSAEAVFRPDLKGRPIVVLSNNDGCCVSRNTEAKAIGIPMGEPLFKIQHLVRKHKIAVFSSNYTLYGDMSRRVMEVLSQFTPQMEIYSIDEAFLAVPDDDFIGFGARIRQTVKQWTGIPVSVGIGPTKVLSKVANRLAKKIGTFIITPEHPVLETVEVGDVWGVGGASAKKLNRKGIYNAAQLRDADDKWVMKELTVVGLKLVRELRGESCLDLELVRERKKGMCVSRSFGKPVTTLTEMKESVATYTARMGEKLRSQHSLACVIHVFFHTNPFAKDDPQCHRTAICRLPVPSSATAELLRGAMECVERTFREGFRYIKAGIIVSEVVNDDARQQNFFHRPDWVRDDRVSAAMDKINREFGARSIQFGAEGLRPKWAARFDRRSPRYTTQWDELLQVRS